MRVYCEYNTCCSQQVLKEGACETKDTFSGTVMLKYRVFSLT